MSLTRAQARKFFDLVDKCASRNNGERVIARLQLSRFTAEHGKEACQEVYDKTMAKAKAAKAKK